ncbi:MAG: ABC transporter substrate-binding protein [Alphaproteobacteria bacterium]|nr:ABC transporter substrate-binding protein [Alphaproteobacteria bacterium]
MHVFRPVLIVLLAAILSGPGARAQTPAPKPQTLVVLLDWFVNPDHGPLIVAQERGYFRDAGLHVELIAPSDPNDPPKLVAAKRADLAISYQPSLTLHAAAGLPLARIATLVATPLNTLVVLADAPIRSLADLRGRRIGFSVGGFEDALLGAMLARAGMTLSDVTLVNVNFALSPALLAGRVDAVIGAFRNFELNQLALEGRPGRAFHPEANGVPAYDELVVVAHRDRLRDPALRRFVDALERGTLSMIDDPEAAWALFVKARPDLDTELNRRAWRDTLPRFAQAPAALDRARYARFAEFLRGRGLLTTAPRLEDYAVELAW